MNRQGSSLLAMSLLAMGGFLLALVVLLTVSLVGLVLGFAAFLLLPVLGPVLVGVMQISESRAAKARLALAGEATALAERPEEEWLPVPRPVTATVVVKDGRCPMGIDLHMSESWTLNGVWAGPELCPRIKKTLTADARQLRGDPTRASRRRECIGKAHRIVFELRKPEPKEVAVSA